MRPVAGKAFAAALASGNMNANTDTDTEAAGETANTWANCSVCRNGADDSGSEVGSAEWA